jgi:hypothetical protein
VENVLRRLHASTGDNAERVLCYDIAAFLTESLRWKGSLQEWLQAASQEPDESFLSRGAASTAQALGLALVQWVVKPQERYGAYGPIGHEDLVYSVALSRDDKRAASASDDRRSQAVLDGSRDGRRVTGGAGWQQRLWQICVEQTSFFST